MKKLTFRVKRGGTAGTLLTPHMHEDGHFVVSKTKFKSDYIRIKDESDLIDWVGRGYSVRMSNPAAKSPRPTSLITPSSIEVSAL